MLGVAGTAEQGRRYLPGLDGLRGIAAVMVLILHCTKAFDVGYIAQSSALAVDFFFLLSGFVVAQAYDARLAAGEISWRRFVALRLVRFYPMLFVGTALGGLVFLVGQQQKYDFGLAGSLLLLAGSFAVLPVGIATGNAAYSAFPIVSPAWSMFFEVFVNVLYGTRLGRIGRRSLAALTACCGVALILTATLWDGPFYDMGFASPTAFLLGFVRVAYPFCAGVLLFRLPWLLAVPSLPVGWIGLLMILLLAAPYSGAWYSLALVLAVFPVLVAAGARARIGAASGRACAALGRLSYPLYLVHEPVLRAFKWAPALLHVRIPEWVMLVATATASVVAAEAVRIGFDEPVRRWLGRRLKQRRRAPGFVAAHAHSAHHAESGPAD